MKGKLEKFYSDSKRTFRAFSEDEKFSKHFQGYYLARKNIGSKLKMSLKTVQKKELAQWYKYV